MGRDVPPPKEIVDMLTSAYLKRKARRARLHPSSWNVLKAILELKKAKKKVDRISIARNVGLMGQYVTEHATRLNKAGLLNMIKKGKTLHFELPSTAKKVGKQVTEKLHPNAQAILSHVKKFGPVNTSEIAPKLKIPLNAVIYHANRLQEKGFVTSPDYDSSTPHGNRTLVAKKRK